MLRPKEAAPIIANHIDWTPALCTSYSIASPVDPNSSTIYPKIKENTGIANPLIAAASAPIVINVLSVREANLKSFEKGTVGLGGTFSVAFFVGDFSSDVGSVM